ncbi:hypothetical protein [Rheinheimera sp. EpRS3]|uniref:hypothetical protein n=1 Tax=Rheinheimera sp. EpRS3 TaxID=1712383 RepID=UPI000749BEAC|nr:hypothetical protein [Rheinheimera sp. EpRS3]KUM52198.1 hypothetical protein AR688_02515 [Rheinheimera sp. EpRS3]
MTPEQMPGYGYPTLAVWPEPWYETQGWLMHDYKICPDGSLKWFKSTILTENGHVKAEYFTTFDRAVSVADERNIQHLANLSKLDLSEQQRYSLELKAKKTIQAKSRLANEEQLMLSEAIRRSKQQERISINDIILPASAEIFREDLFNQLQTLPYLRIAFTRTANQKAILYRQNERAWSKPYNVGRKGAQLAERSKVANGFGFSAESHWGKIKASIRKILLPRANQLLQLASVQRLLAEAKSQGHQVVVSNGYVFWFEESGNIGWQVKETASSESSDGSAIWFEGTIISKNHGRLVVLPYIKENGEKVQGHTKNAPNDGRAKPRHPDSYVNLPFHVLKDDLMIGLFGELPYE